MMLSWEMPSFQEAPGPVTRTLQKEHERTIAEERKQRAQRRLDRIRPRRVSRGDQDQPSLR